MSYDLHHTRYTAKPLVVNTDVDFLRLGLFTKQCLIDVREISLSRSVIVHHRPGVVWMPESELCSCNV